MTSLRPLAALLLLLPALSAHAHIGSKDVFEQLEAGPYKLFVTIRTPTVIPGIATVEARSSGAPISSLEITPVPLTGEAAKHPPASDPMHASAEDPAFFTGTLWLMASGSWQVRLQMQGAAGAATAGVPVPAMPLSILPMQRPLGIVLAVLGVILTLGMAGIVAAAVRESRLTPGLVPAPSRSRRALLAGGATLALMTLFLYGGDKWWNVEAAAYATDLYKPAALHASLEGNTLDLTMGAYSTKQSRFKTESNDQLLPDHGHLMHLYAIRQPEMDAAFHLHPAPVSEKHLSMVLPAMPPGVYRLYADIVRPNGFPETLTSTLTIPAGLQPAPLAPEDASALPPPLAKGDLGPAYRLPDGYTMVWDPPAAITANTAYTFRFRLLDAAGHPAGEMQPYLGMAGHAAFVKTDGTAFAHTHPEGSAAMAAMMLANEANSPADAPSAKGMDRADGQPVPSTVDFPYGFPAPGRYRIFIQMKHASTVETGVFDAEVR